jgi:hypothetical protein
VQHVVRFITATKLAIGCGEPSIGQWKSWMSTDRPLRYLYRSYVVFPQITAYRYQHQRNP